MITHLACIMDGNRRWAQQQGWLPWRGHSEGIEVTKNVINFCLQKGIPYVSFYTYSIENFINRSSQEIDYLLNLMKKQADSIIADFKQKEIKLCFIGDRSFYSKAIKELVERVEHETANGTKLQVSILFGYGGRQEIVDATKKIIAKVQSGELDQHEVTDELFTDYLWTSGMPDPDIIMRTGGYKRLSNFLLYQAAYSEFYFLDCLWPDLTKEDLDSVINNFNECKRNFGK